MANAKYNSKKLGRNLILFESLLFDRNIAPTDIDFMLESNGDIFIFGEFKHRNSPNLTWGQKILFENLIANLAKPTIAFLAIHDSDGDVIASESKIRAVYYNSHFKSHGSYQWVSKRWNEMTVSTLTRVISKKYGFSYDTF